MVTILIVGAGKSSTFLIESMLKFTQRKSTPWKVIVADSDEESLKNKVKHFPNGEIAVFDVTNERERQALVKRADIVLSLMPPHLHILLAKDCLQFHKHLITSSYVSDEMKELDKAAKDAGLMFLCEMGLDPGLDHMSASLLFDSIHRVNCEVISFKSYCGGLVAPESDDNPWHYKFSWNPINIINAGKDGARFLEGGTPIEVGYHDMFAHEKHITCEGVGDLAYYPNRDSLDYIHKYNLHYVKDFMRATLRHPDFCKGWNALVTMGVTDNAVLHDTAMLTEEEWIKKVVGYDNTNISLRDYTFDKYDIRNPQIQKMIDWLGFFTDTKLNIGLRSSGEILLDVLKQKWAMKPEDKDMVVMQHEVEYAHPEKSEICRLKSSMVVVGDDNEHSAMAKTVGLPMAIAAELLAFKLIRPLHGVIIPTNAEVYKPVLNRLEKKGLFFNEVVKS
ncbi:MAG: saccharopine dehydrogenase C-terminal domain-containing protein [Chitinophagaceae bacterium]